MTGSEDSKSTLISLAVCWGLEEERTIEQKAGRTDFYMRTKKEIFAGISDKERDRILCDWSSQYLKHPDIDIEAFFNIMMHALVTDKQWEVATGQIA